MRTMLRMSAAHRLLAIPEVLVQVAEHAKDESTVASLAQTCRFFCSPALDVLWRSQSGLANIVKCMPADLWEIQPELYGRGTLTFKRAMRPSDWDRFNVYAPRVRVLALRLCGRRDVRLEGDVYLALSMYALSMPLFPNLRTWYCLGIPQATAGPDHRLFLGAHLVDLTVAWDAFDQRAAFLLACLSQRCHKLQTIDLQVDHAIAAAQDLWLQPGLFASLKELYYVRVNADASFPAAAFVELQRLPELEELVIETHPSPVWSLPPASLETPSSFRALISLHLNSGHGKSCVDMLAAVFFPVLEILEIEAGLVGPLGHLFKAIHEHCSHTSLRILHVAGLDPVDEGADEDVKPEPAATADDFRYLHAFHRLEEVWVDTLHDFVLADDDLRHMALSWPRLRSLRLLPAEELNPPNWGTPAAGTLTGLMHFARHCPALRSLWLVLDTSSASAEQILFEFPDALEVESAVTHLMVGTSDACDGDAHEVAKSLAIIFPHLEEFAGDYPFIHNDTWDEIERLYPACLRAINAMRRRHCNRLPVSDTSTSDDDDANDDDGDDNDDDDDGGEEVEGFIWTLTDDTVTRQLVS